MQTLRKRKPSACFEFQFANHCTEVIELKRNNFREKGNSIFAENLLK